ncbi:MAG: hypothetical protein ACOH2Q_22785 [Rhodococcus sp. (in: high G+C Gram-positive bacteria)]
MYHYEQILNEHRQRVARGVQNYERQRVATEREAERIVGERNSQPGEVMDEEVFNGRENENETESDPRIGAASSVG